MTLGARPGLLELHERYRDRVEIVSVYVREAHPGDRYRHHDSAEQKMRYARDWKEQDRIPWTVAVDDVEGTVHRAFDTQPNSVYLIDRSGHVAFRALWAGQKGLLRSKIEELLAHHAAGEERVVLGERENLVIPLLRGSAAFLWGTGRGGEGAIEDFRRELGEPMYWLQVLMSQLDPVINRGNRDLRG